MAISPLRGEVGAFCSSLSSYFPAEKQQDRTWQEGVLWWPEPNNTATEVHPPSSPAPTQSRASSVGSSPPWSSADFTGCPSLTNESSQAARQTSEHKERRGRSMLWRFAALFPMNSLEVSNMGFCSRENQVDVEGRRTLSELCFATSVPCDHGSVI